MSGSVLLPFCLLDSTAEIFSSSNLGHEWSDWCRCLERQMYALRSIIWFINPIYTIRILAYEIERTYVKTMYFK
jgi:hypothetical protein